MLSHLFEKRETIIGDASAYLKMLSGRFNLSRAGVPVDDFTALNHSAVWAGIDFIASTMAQLPLQLRRVDSKTGEIENSTRLNTPLSRMVSYSPNPRQSSFVLRQMTQANAVFHGNGYIWIERERVSGIPIALWPLPSRQVEPRVVDGTLIYQAVLNGTTFNAMAADILHIPGFSLDGLRGLSFLKYMKEAIGLGLAAQQFGSAFFGDGANPRFIVTHPGEVGAEGLSRISNQLNEMYGGLKNAMKAAVLDEGMKVEALSFNAEQSQFIESRKDNRVEIAGAMRIPPQMIGVYDRATWSNAESMDIFVAKYTLSSWVVRWEQELDRKLLTDRQRQSGMYFKINLNAIMRGDTKARTEYYKAMLQGVLSPNEVRALEEFNTIPGLDEPFIPLNMVSADSLKEPEPEPEPADPNLEPDDSEDISQ